MTTRLSVLLLVVALVSSIEFVVNLEPLGQYCGYQHLLIHTKYVFAVSPHAEHSYAVDIKTMATNQNPDVKQIYSDTSRHFVKISKLAPQTNFFSFCVKNTGTVHMDFGMVIQTGLELMDFSNTPDVGEKELINHELQLLQNQMNALMSQLQAIQYAKTNTEEMFKMMSVRTLGFGILGGVVLGIVNVALYFEIRKTLREYKLA